MMLNRISNALSGEFLLANRPNGGTVILFRSLYVTALLYTLAIAVRSFTTTGATISFSASQLSAEINGTIPWFGAIFAGVYAALYARYSSQWSYLANLYNQIMAAYVSMSPAQQTESKTLVNWQAAFVEDAADLHLATKPMFAMAISEMLKEQAIRDVFAESTVGGHVRLAALQARIEESLRNTDSTP